MLYVKEFPSRQALEYFLQGKILGSKVFAALKEKINVRNLTLTFTTPAKTITFPDTSAFEAATPAAVLAEAESQSAGRLWLIKPPAGASNDQQFALLDDGNVFTGGTAAPALGLPPSPGPYTVGADAIALASVASIYYVDGKTLGLVYDA